MPCYELTSVGCLELFHAWAVFPQSSNLRRPFLSAPPLLRVVGRRSSCPVVPSRVMEVVSRQTLKAFGSYSQSCLVCSVDIGDIRSQLPAPRLGHRSAKPVELVHHRAPIIVSEVVGPDSRGDHRRVRPSIGLGQATEVGAIVP